MQSKRRNETPGKSLRERESETPTKEGKRMAETSGDSLLQCTYYSTLSSCYAQSDPLFLTVTQRGRRRRWERPG